MSYDYLKESLLKQARDNDSGQSRRHYYFAKTFGDIYLTDRQVEIASMLLREMTYKEIAVSLGISDRTVESHINILREKLRARNKKALVEVIEQLRGTSHAHIRQYC